MSKFIFIKDIVDDKYIKPIDIKLFLKFLMEVGIYEKYMIRFIERQNKVTDKILIMFVDELLYYDILEECVDGLEEFYDITKKWEEIILENKPNFIFDMWCNLVDQLESRFQNSEVVKITGDTYENKIILVDINNIPPLTDIMIPRFLGRKMRQDIVFDNGKEYKKLCI